MRNVLFSILTLMIIACNPNKADMGEKIEVASYKIIGISLRTSNEKGQSMQDMGQLWGQFYADSILSRIPNRLNEDVYTVYTDYQSNYEGAYTAMIGCKVSSLDNIPEGMVGREIPAGQYTRYMAKGKMPDAVIKTWQEIWKNDNILRRKYTADFEVYSLKPVDPENAEVAIYVATE